MEVDRDRKEFRVIGLPTNVVKLIYRQRGYRPRAALLLSRRVVFHSLSEFITSDLVSVIVDMPIKDSSWKIAAASTYFAHD